MRDFVTSIGRIPWRFYGVWVLPVCGAMAFAGYGSVLYTWPVFFPVVVKEFGWSAAVAATASSLARLEGGFEGPIVGYILDRWGARELMLIGGCIVGTGFVLLGLFLDSMLFYYIIFGFMINIAYNSSNYVASYKVVGDWWVKWRARAISIMILPTAIAGTFGPVIGTWAIQNWGWRQASIYMGILVVIIYIPCALFIRRKRPEFYGLLPDGDDPQKAMEVAAAKAAALDKKAAEALLYKETAKKETDLTIGQALRSLAFWNYTGGNIFSSFASGSILLFVPFHLQSRGYSAMEAAAAAGLMMSITYVGRVTVMLLGDIGSMPKWLTVISRVFQAAGAISMANASSDASYMAYLYAIFYGVGYGMSIPLTPSLRGWLFGRMNFGQIQGWASTFAMLGTVTSPIWAGWMYDLNGNYYVSYMTAGLGFLIAAFVFGLIRRPKGREAARPAPSAA